MDNQTFINLLNRFELLYKEPSRQGMTTVDDPTGDEEEYRRLKEATARFMCKHDEDL